MTKGKPTTAPESGIKLTTLRSGGYLATSISTRDDFFKEPVIIHYRDGVLTFTKPTLAYKGQTNKAYVGKSHCELKFINSELRLDVQDGLYEFAEESDEDTRIVNFNTPTL